MISTRNMIIPLFIYLFLLCSFCSDYEQKESNFFGDSTLSQKSYWKKLIKGRTRQILKNQNNLYQKAYTDNKQSQEILLSKNVILKLIKVKTPNKNDIKINLYTYLGNKKVDSIQFYRNISGDGFGTYNCLSYFNPKTNKIWQIKYFPVNPNPEGDALGIISYTESSISTNNGTIQLDSLYYLDEFLEIEVGKNHLYY